MSYDLIEIPDGITPLVGYRAWMPQDGILMSCYRPVPWPVGKPLASDCIHPTFHTLNDRGVQLAIPPKYHTSPNKDCTCGIYALNELPSNYSTSKGKPPLPWPHDAIIGLILGWGHIIMGTKGFRAEYAKPIALIKRPRSQKKTLIIEELSNRYGLELIDAKEVRDGYRQRTKRDSD